jgi:hypothetical protein
MANCAAIKADGSRCNAGALPLSDYCYNHDPAREEERKRNASKGGKRGGRGRPVAELAELKKENDRLRKLMLSGELEPRMLSVATQSINVSIRCVDIMLEAKEQEELAVRLEALEAAEEKRKQANEARRRRSGGYR